MKPSFKTFFQIFLETSNFILTSVEPTFKRFLEKVKKGIRYLQSHKWKFQLWFFSKLELIINFVYAYNNKTLMDFRKKVTKGTSINVFSEK